MARLEREQERIERRGQEVELQSASLLDLSFLNLGRIVGDLITERIESAGYLASRISDRLERRRKGTDLSNQDIGSSRDLVSHRYLGSTISMETSLVSLMVSLSFVTLSATVSKQSNTA